MLRGDIIFEKLESAKDSVHHTQDSSELKTRFKIILSVEKVYNR